jgi:geranylgeranyl pyrophosphate synthase
MLIIEGSDCLGKTTFARKLEHYCARFLPTYYLHMTKQNMSSFDFLHDYERVIDSCIVADRFHLGTLAYPDHKMDENILRKIESSIYAASGLIMVIYASDLNWYQKILNNDKRPNMSTETKQRMFEANLVYKSFVDCSFEYYNLQPSIDLALNIKSSGSFEIWWPDAAMISRVGNRWIERRTA